jgi:hypothetical protein
MCDSSHGPIRCRGTVTPPLSNWALFLALLNLPKTREQYLAEAELHGVKLAFEWVEDQA